MNAFDELWGLTTYHSYRSKDMHVSFPVRKKCRLVGDSSSRSIEHFFYASRVQACNMIKTATTQRNPSGYIVASTDGLLHLFDADYGLLSMGNEAKV